MLPGTDHLSTMVARDRDKTINGAVANSGRLTFSEYWVWIDAMPESLDMGCCEMSNS